MKITSSRRNSAIIAGLLIGMATSSSASEFMLVNRDAPGIGLNDTTPVRPVEGNPGRTLGEQRRLAYQYALDLWGAILVTQVPVRVEASMAPLTCTRDRIVLGQAGTIGSVFSTQVQGAPFPDTWYPAALANAISGIDHDPASNDISTEFSSSIDMAECQAHGARGWYYGLGGNGTNASGNANFLNVIMHEIGHGLGVQGRRLFGSSAPWDQMAWSNRFDRPMSSLDFQDAFTAATTPGDVVWVGANANPTARAFAENHVDLSIAEPEAALLNAWQAEFGELDASLFPGDEIVLLQDAVDEGAAATSQGCNADRIANAGQLAGRIALIDRGVCEFGLKALNAQRHGATAVIIANNAAGDFFGPSGGASGSQVTIPVIAIRQGDGNRLRNGAVSGGLEINEDRFYGMDDNGRIRLYAPATFVSGSTYSHVDSDMKPNAVMEPSETPTLTSYIFLDMAIDMFEDMGWPIARDATARLGNCDTGVPIIRDVSFVPGANLIAQQNLCRVEAGTSRAKYQQCMTNHALKLRDQGHLSNAEVLNVRQCVAR